MAASRGNLNMVGEKQNLTTDDCFHSRNTVLQGQPFGGIPTVLFLNIILWVVSPALHGGQWDLRGWIIKPSRVQQGPQVSRQMPATVVGTP